MRAFILAVWFPVCRRSPVFDSEKGASCRTIRPASFESITTGTATVAQSNPALTGDSYWGCLKDKVECVLFNFSENPLRWCIVDYGGRPWRLYSLTVAAFTKQQIRLGLHEAMVQTAIQSAGDGTTATYIEVNSQLRGIAHVRDEQRWMGLTSKLDQPTA